MFFSIMIVPIDDYVDANRNGAVYNSLDAHHLIGWIFQIATMFDTHGYANQAYLPVLI